MGHGLSFGYGARIGSFEFRSPFPHTCEATAPAKVALHPTCGRPDRVGVKKESHRLNKTTKQINNFKYKRNEHS